MARDRETTRRGRADAGSTLTAVTNKSGTGKQSTVDIRPEEGEDTLFPTGSSSSRGSQKVITALYRKKTTMMKIKKTPKEKKKLEMLSDFEDNKKPVIPTCHICGTIFKKNHSKIEALGRSYHTQHFICNTPIDDNTEVDVTMPDFSSRGPPHRGSGTTGIGGDRSSGPGAPSTPASPLPSLTKFSGSGPVCGKHLQAFTWFDLNGEPSCESCYRAYHAAKCARCELSIKNGGVRALAANWHEDHFTCGTCSRPLRTFLEKDGVGHCEPCYITQFLPRCSGCSEPILREYVRAAGSIWHQECLVCAECGAAFRGSRIYERDGRPLCRLHYDAAHGLMCPVCEKKCLGHSLSFKNRKYHPDHFVCAGCLQPLVVPAYLKRYKMPWCLNCVKQMGKDPHRVLKEMEADMDCACLKMARDGIIIRDCWPKFSTRKLMSELPNLQKMADAFDMPLPKLPGKCH